MVIITVDGPAASGKGTIAQKIARYYQLPLLPSGNFYRLVAYLAKREGLKLAESSDLRALLSELESLRYEIDPFTFIFRKDRIEATSLRDPEIAKNASLFSSLSLVRRALLPMQQKYFDTITNVSTNNVKGGVSEGRDMGSVVFPEAPVKLYLTASLSARANRRGFDENCEDLGKIKASLVERDYLDFRRKEAPLLKPSDAILIDSTKFLPEDTFRKVIEVIDSVLKEKSIDL